MRLLAVIAGRLMAAYVRLVAATSRIEGGPATREQIVLALWHEYNLVGAVVAFRLRGDHHHVSFSTQTFRGDVVNSLLAGLGHGSVPLPAEDQRAEAARLARSMASLAAAGSSLVVSPDGPVGPYRRAKPGALILAREAGLPLVAWAVAARPKLRLRRRWDKHVVPLPFGRLRLEQSAPLRIGPGEPVRPVLERLQAALDEVAARADAVGG